MANGTSDVSPLPLGIPVLMVNGWNLPQLLKCKSRILLAAGVTDEAQHLETIIIWQFHPNSFSWAEITRMPPLIFNVISSSLYIISDCLGVEDYICFFICDPRAKIEREIEREMEREIKLAFFNLNQNSWELHPWQLLPSCPTARPPKIIAFEVRLDMVC